MKCPNCDSDFVTLVYEDSFKCKECGNIIKVEYMVCQKCGYTWRTNGGDFIDGVTVEERMEEITEGINSLLEHEEESGDFNRGNFIFSDLDDPLPTKSMSDMIHRCIKCGALAYPIGDGVFKCSYCGFEWEVLTEAE